NPRSDTSFLIVPVAIDGSSFPEPDRPHARACSRESHGERVPSGRYRLLTPGRSLVNPAEDPLPAPSLRDAIDPEPLTLVWTVALDGFRSRGLVPSSGGLK